MTSTALPTTSYGYVPPPDATARGWRCADAQCGAGGEPAPSGRPFACPECGSPTDPELDEPWATAARGLWLEARVRTAPAMRAPFWAERLITWRYERDRAAGDRRAMADLRAVVRASPQADPARLFHETVVRLALADDELDVAADEIAHWSARSGTTELDHDGGVRTNVRSLLQAMLAFVEHPRAAEHPACPAVRVDARRLRADVRGILGGALERRARVLDKARRSALPPDEHGRLVAYADYALDAVGSGYDAGEMWTLVLVPRLPAAVADPEALCRELAVVAGDSGKASFGAQRMVAELRGGELRGPHFLALRRAGLVWFRDIGVDPALLTAAEKDAGGPFSR